VPDWIGSNFHLQAGSLNQIAPDGRCQGLFCPSSPPGRFAACAGAQLESLGVRDSGGIVLKNWLVVYLALKKCSKPPTSDD